MPTHRERMLAAMRGEMVDVIPFVPRLDLWWLANVTRGTLPAEFEGMLPDDISRSRGWAVYHMVPNFADVSGPEDALHRAIGLFNFKQSVYRWEFGGGVEVNVDGREGRQIVEYHTPLGMVRTAGGLTEEMRRAGVSLGWVQESLIKEPREYEIAGYIFRHLEVDRRGFAGRGGALGGQLRRHAHLPAVLREGDPPLAAPGVGEAGRPGEDRGHPHRRGEVSWT
jgi:hypothetical protein